MKTTTTLKEALNKIEEMSLKLEQAKALNECSIDYLATDSLGAPTQNNTKEIALAKALECLLSEIDDMTEDITHDLFSAIDEVKNHEND